MAKKQKQPAKTCADCIHESACRVWTDGRYISDAAATQCPNHETVKESSAYLCGVLDERKRKQTNADRIRAMSDEELAEIIAGMYNDDICTMSCECDECFLRVLCCKDVGTVEALKWLKQPAEVDNG